MRRPEASRWRPWHHRCALPLLLGTLTGLASATPGLEPTTWISGVGDDANPCSRTAPCRTFAAAMALTESGGTISALDPGAFDFLDSAGTLTYQPLVITKPLTIDGGAGQVAGLGPLAPEASANVASQQDAIVIDLPAGSNGGVTLRHLRLNGNAGTGRHGIRIASAGSVSLHGLDVAHFASSCVQIDASANGVLLDVAETVLSHCAIGVDNAAAQASVALSGSTIVQQEQIGVRSPSAQSHVMSSGALISHNAQPMVVRNVTASTPALGAQGAMAAVAAGTATAQISGGGAGCGFSAPRFAAPTDVAQALPAQVQAVQSAFRFDTTPCGTGAVVTVTLTYEQSLPHGTVLYKYGPATAGAPTSTWFALAHAQFSADRRSVTYTVQDNGIGDGNLANGLISDPVVPALSLTGAVPIPTLSRSGLLLMVAGFVGVVMALSRR
jgi:hypothetical protein